MKQLLKSHKGSLAIITGMLVGVLLFVAIRFLFNNPAPTHYHANFAVFIDGKREEFKSPTFYEEIQACSVITNPRSRVHMHQPDNNVVHVHDTNVTWGMFFESLGWALGPNALVTDNATYQGTPDKPLVFILNHIQVTSPFDQVIKSEDTLLISYNPAQNNLADEYKAAASPITAHTANTQQDPASCHGTAKRSVSDRLKSAIW